VEDGIRFFRHIGTISQSERRHISLDILLVSLFLGVFPDTL
jgi:hypothetical protein